MYTTTKIKMHSFNWLFRRVFSYISKDYEHRFQRLLNFLKGISFSNELTGLVQKVESTMKDNPTFKMFINRLFTDYNRDYINTLLGVLLINVGFFNTPFTNLNAKNDLPSPFTILISPTMRCNLRCTGCYAGNYTRDDDLTPSLINKIITQGEDMGVYLYTILGGEPFIYKELMDIVNAHPRSAFQIFTNGTLVDENTIKKFWKTKNVVPVISVEGGEEETDKRRGKGVYKKVTWLMDTLKKEGIPFGYSAVLTRENFDALTKPEYYTDLASKGAFFGWTFLYMPVGRDDTTALMPTAEQRGEYGKVTRYVRDHYPIFPMDFWNDAPYVGGCIAGGTKYLHINHKGEVEPCIFVHFAVDNIKEKSLQEVLRSPFFREIRSRQPFHENLFLPCMIIDSPWVLREVVAKTGPHPTHNGADDIITKFKDDLDKYAEEVRKVLNPIWEDGFKDNFVKKA
jgi:MoaA/NifB/PqqE/SkfB family radical SAM enzyme